MIRLLGGDTLSVQAPLELPKSNHSLLETAFSGLFEQSDFVYSYAYIFSCKLRALGKV